MQKNMGNIDRIIRILVAIAIILLWYTGMISGTLAIVALVIAGIFVLTSWMNFCPLYTVIGLSTKK